MSSNNNFLLKIHMEEDSVTDIFLNKEKRSFTFVNDECVSDLIVPNTIINKLNMMLDEKVVDDSGDDDFYAEYERDGEVVREYNRRTIRNLQKLVTKISIDDFVENIASIKQNDYYIDNISEKYGSSKIPAEVKRILSYTTNGVSFDGKDSYYMMPHDDIVNYDKKIKDFIPFMIKNIKNYIGYNYQEELFEEYSEEEKVASNKTLGELVLGEEIELLDSDDSISKSVVETSEELEPKYHDIVKNIDDQLDIAISINEESPLTEEKKEEKAFEQEVSVDKIEESDDIEIISNEVDKEYDKTIENIDYQLDRLTTGIEEEKKKNTPVIKSKSKKYSPSLEVKEEIREGVIKSLDEIEKTNNIIDEINSDISKIKKDKTKKIDSNLKKEKKKKDNDPMFVDFIKQYDEKKFKEKEQEEFQKLVDAYDEQMKKKEQDQILFNEFLKEYDAKLKKTKENEEFRKFLVEYEIKNRKQIENRYFQQFLKEYDEKKRTEKENALFQEFLRQYDTKKAKEQNQILFQEFLKQYEEKLKRNKENEKFKKFLVEYDKKMQKEKEDEAFREFLIEYDKKKSIELTDKLLKVKEENEEKEDALTLNEIIYNSINNGFDNYKINFNDTQKLVVKHLPYYEIPNDFDVIQIPEIENDKITLIPDDVIDFGKIKLVVNKLKNNKVDLLVKSASNIIDGDNQKVKKGTHLIVDLRNEVNLRLNKSGIMETWSLTMEMSTFVKELRNIDYNKVMNIIVGLDSYNALGNIEKYELQKSVMLFINLVMINNDEDKLEELYDTLYNDPESYEEYITKYNIDNSDELNNVLNTYEDKKAYTSKLNYVKGLINAKWLDYPRYIFSSHKYFDNDEFLVEFISDLNNSIKENDFSDYLNKLFKQYKMFTKLNPDEKESLNKCLEYLSIVYKYRPNLGENIKYNIEKEFMTGATEEEMALLISKLCRRGIKDYSLFIEYDTMMKEKYRLGELKYPIYSDSFEIDSIRNGGEEDEY